LFGSPRGPRYSGHAASRSWPAHPPPPGQRACDAGRLGTLPADHDVGDSRCSRRGGSTGPTTARRPARRPGARRPLPVVPRRRYLRPEERSAKRASGSAAAGADVVPRSSRPGPGATRRDRLSHGDIVTVGSAGSASALCSRPRTRGCPNRRAWRSGTGTSLCCASVRATEGRREGRTKLGRSSTSSW
jgi:hypothetical protein